MKQKILFTDLLKSHSDSEIKLKIDNEYTYHKNNQIYFINIDFNCFNFMMHYDIYSFPFLTILMKIKNTLK